MATFEAMLPIGLLLPTQKSVSQERMQALQSSGYSLPVIAVPFEDIEGEWYILPDGHHRSRLAHDQSLELINAVIVTEDDDIAKMNLNDDMTLEDYYDDYVYKIRPPLLAAGVVSIETLVIS